MGRVKDSAQLARKVLRAFDRTGVVSPRGDALLNLLSTDWSSILARQVLKESPVAHPSVRHLFGLPTISVRSLVASL